MLGSPSRLLLLTLILLTGCISAPSRAADTRPGTAAPSSASPEGRKAITIALRGDINALAGDADQIGRNSPPSFYVQEFVDASLTVRDQDDLPRGLLAVDLPSLDTGSWVVRDDGRMEVTWKLRSDARWQDGTPVTASDLQFSWQVSSDPATPIGKRGPASLIDHVDAVDDTTAVFYWKSPSGYGGEMGNRELAILPRHVLEDAFLSNKAAFHTSPYFTSASGFVGSGAYRPVEWERNSFLTTEAYDGYFLGRPRIDRVTFRFIEDSRAALASVLAGASDMAYQAVEFTESIPVRDTWAKTGEGTVWLQPNQLRIIQPQMRAEYARPADLVNRDVRRALAFAMDRPSIAEAANPGSVMVVDSDGVPGTRFGDALRSRAVHYDYNPTEAEALLADAGWRRGSDGILEKGGQKFQLELLGERQAEQEGVYSVMRESYRQVGVDLSFVELARDPEQQVVYPGLRHRGAFTNELRTIQNFQSSRIASAETRWVGQNLNGYSNPLVDREIDALDGSIRTDERVAHAAEVWGLVTDDAGSVGLYIRPVAYIIRKGITGPIPNSLSGSVTSNVQSWDVQ